MVEQQRSTPRKCHTNLNQIFSDRAFLAECPVASLLRQWAFKREFSDQAAKAVQRKRQRGQSSSPKSL